MVDKYCFFNILQKMFKIKYRPYVNASMCKALKLRLALSKLKYIIMYTISMFDTFSRGGVYRSHTCGPVT